MYFLSLSGGLDSTVLCAWLTATHGPSKVQPVFFLYGSKHNAWECESARKVAAYFSLSLQEVDLRPVFSGISSALLAHDSRPVPGGDYAEETMSATVVPGRNLIFASVLASMAENRGGGIISLATHSGDHHLYPDCRMEFNHSLAETVQQSSAHKVRLETPFECLTKADIVTRGLSLEAPFELTRSCYQGESSSCGVCGTCRERIEAFAANGIADPIRYVSG